MKYDIVYYTTKGAKPKVLNTLHHIVDARRYLSKLVDLLRIMPIFERDTEFIKSETECIIIRHIDKYLSEENRVSIEKRQVH